MSWTASDGLQWRTVDLPGGGRRLDLRDPARRLLGGIMGGGLTAVLAWALVARLGAADASVPSLMTQGVLTAIVGIFTLSAVLGTIRFEVDAEVLKVQGQPVMPLEEIRALEPVQRGAYAGIGVRRASGEVQALPPVFLSKRKAKAAIARLEVTIRAVVDALPD